MKEYNILKDFSIDGIRGAFHCFQCMDKRIVLNTRNLSVIEIPRGVYNDLIDADVNNILLKSAAEGYVKKRYKNLKDTGKSGLMSATSMIPVLTLILTHECNMQCEYCFDRYSAKQTMSYTTAIDIIQKYAENHSRFQIIFFGGEPLLKFELIKGIVEYCERLKMRSDVSILYGITTNGKWLNKDIIDFLNNYNFSVTISADGVLLNDTKYIGSNIKYIDERSFVAVKRINNLFIRSTIMPENINNIDTLFRYFSDMHPSGIAFSPVADKTIKYSHQNIVDWKKKLESITYKAQKKRLGISIDGITGMARNIAEHRLSQNQCGAAIGNITVNGDGSMCFCHRFVNTAINSELITDLQEYKYNMCSGCWAYAICGGLCLHGIFVSENTANAICELNKKRVELACWLALRYIKAKMHEQHI